MSLDGPVFVPSNTWCRLLLVALVLLLGGCASSLLQGPVEESERTYLLQWQPAKVPAAPDPGGPGLVVMPIHSAPGFDSSDMAYMRNAHEIAYFARHRWVDAPARMLDPLLVQAAAQSGLFHSVAEAGGGVRADLRLDSQLLYLQQVCRLNPSELQLGMRVTLVEVASARVIGSRVLSVSEPISERSPYAGVEAANRAVARLLEALQGFLAEQLRKGRAG